MRSVRHGWRRARHVTALVVYAGLSLTVLAAATLIGLGEWYTPGVVHAESLAPAAVSTTTTTTPRADLGVTPAATVLAALLSLAPAGDQISPISLTTPFDPVRSACTTTPTLVPLLSGSATVTTLKGGITELVSVYPAGEGVPALAAETTAAEYCGYDHVTTLATPLLGFSATAQVLGSPYQEIVTGLSDVVITLSSPASPDLLAIASDLTDTLRAAMSSCVNLSPTTADATRNPAYPGYTGLTIAQVVPAPSNLVTPDPNLLNASPPAVIPPRVGTITVAPVAPVAPAYPPLTASVHVPTTDSVGPGCGWAFTGTVIPATPLTDSTALITNATQRLTAAWNAWPASVTNYLSALATYQADLSSYDTYVATSTTTSTTTTTTTTTTLPIITTTTTLPVILPTTTTTG